MEKLREYVVLGETGPGAWEEGHNKYVFTYLHYKTFPICLLGEVTVSCEAQGRVGVWER